MALSFIYMLLIILLKLSFANYFIFSICLFFVWAWIVLGTNIFANADQIKGSEKGQANLLKTNEGDITSEEQKMINDKLASMGQILPNEGVDERIKNNFIIPVKPVDSGFNREEKTINPEINQNNAENSSDALKNPINQVDIKNNASQTSNQTLEKESDNVPASANEDDNFKNSDDTSPDAFNGYSEGGIGAMDDNYVEEVIFVTPKNTIQTMCRTDWQSDLEGYLVEFREMEVEQQEIVRVEGQKIFEKIKEKQLKEHNLLKIDMASLMYKTETNFEKIATSDFLLKDELFYLNTINLTGLEFNTEILKGVVIKEVLSLKLPINHKI